MATQAEAPYPYVAGDIARLITLVALMIYMYTLVGCSIFRQGFFRQLAYVFQIIKIFLIFGALLPCVLHGQVERAMPSVKGRGEMFFAVIGFLILNILFAFAVKYMGNRLVKTVWRPPNRRRKKCRPKCDKSKFSNCLGCGCNISCKHRD